MEEETENPNCPCPETWCERPGKCSECQKYHHAHGNKTCCGK